jgi:hypothetical protein
MRGCDDFYIRIYRTAKVCWLLDATSTGITQRKVFYAPQAQTFAYLVYRETAWLEMEGCVMTTLRQAAQQALEALESGLAFDAHSAVLQNLRTALKQPEQKPVAWTTMPEADDWDFVSGSKNPTGKLEGKWVPLYTTPPAAQRQWVRLTPEEILDLFDLNNVYGSKWVEFAKTVEDKLKERNT